MATAIFDYLNSPAFVKELQRGSPEALGHLDSKLTKPLLGFLQNVMNVPRADAEELASDVLLAVSSHVHTFRPDGPAKLTTWIYKIAKNKAIDFHRKPRLETVSIRDESPGAGPSGCDAGRNDNYLSWLNTELAELDKKDRMLLMLRAKGIQYVQIAEWLKTTEGAARTQHNRLMVRLMRAAKGVVPGKEKTENG